MSKIYDFAIVGGGLYGLTLAKLLKKKIPTSSMVLLEKKRKTEFVKESKYFVQIETGDKYETNMTKYALMNEGFDKMTQFCADNSIDNRKVGQLIIAFTKEERERMKKIFKESENFTKISLKEAKEMESLLNQKNLDLADIYHLKNTSLVDFNKVRKILMDEITKMNEENQLDLKYNTYLEKIEESSGKIKLMTKNVKTLKEETIETNFIINASGTESLDIAHQLNVLKEYSSLKIFAEYFHANVPAKEKYPNVIMSTPPYSIHPGLSFYTDDVETKTIGPVFNITDNSYSFFKKLKVMNEWRKVYQLFHEKNIDPQMEYKYNSKNYVSLSYINMYGFPMVKLFNNNNKLKFESSVMYSLGNKKFEEDVHLIKEKNSLHLLNFNLHGGFTQFLSACEEAVNKI